MRKFLFLVFSLMLSFPAFARIFPSNVQYGEVTAVDQSSASIDKQAFHRAPGLRIFNQKNAIIFLHQLPLKSKVAYQIDGRGELFQIWLLTDAELRNQPK